MNNFVFEGNKTLNKHLGASVFPLFTKKGLADRWKVNKQSVNNWQARHIDFPRPVEGFINGGSRYYPLYEVERYEKARGIKRP